MCFTHGPSFTPVALVFITAHITVHLHRFTCGPCRENGVHTTVDGAVIVNVLTVQ